MNKLIKGVNDLQSWCIKNNRQDILQDWDYNKNKVKPEEICFFSSKKYWFKCKNGHTYRQSLLNKCSKLQGCPNCNTKKSVPELTIYEICKKYTDINTISGKKIDNNEIDVFIPSLNICLEYDGIYWYNKQQVIIRDIKKNKIYIKF